jgi:5'(3')-deoxyribonucleotidase
MKKIYVDYDSCMVDSVKAICELYNKDFKYYKNFKEIKPNDVFTWDFHELSCSNPSYINTYFTQPRFFEIVDFFPNCRETLNFLSINGYEINIVSMGYYSNLILKKEWCKKKIPYAKFIGLDFDCCVDKSSIDMKDGSMFIDDNSKYLFSSNCKRSVMFGEKKEWNFNWNGEVLKKWDDLIIDNKKLIIKTS